MFEFEFEFDQLIQTRITYFCNELSIDEHIHYLCLILNRIPNARLYTRIHGCQHKQTVTISTVKRYIQSFPKSKWICMVAAALRVPLGCILVQHIDLITQLRDICMQIYKLYGKKRFLMRKYNFD